MSAHSGGNSERVESLRDLLDRFDRSGAHFREARRQTLLGVREALAGFEDVAMGYRNNVPQLGALIGGAVVVRGLLDLLISRLPPLDDSDRNAQTEARIDALGVLRDLLVAELARAGEVDPSRREGLMTVIGVIDQEIERLAEALATAANEPTTLQGVDWIEVES